MFKPVNHVSSSSKIARIRFLYSTILSAVLLGIGQIAGAQTLPSLAFNAPGGASIASARPLSDVEEMISQINLPYVEFLDANFHDVLEELEDLSSQNDGNARIRFISDRFYGNHEVNPITVKAWNINMLNLVEVICILSKMDIKVNSPNIVVFSDGSQSNVQEENQADSLSAVSTSQPILGSWRSNETILRFYPNGTFRVIRNTGYEESWLRRWRTLEGVVYEWIRNDMPGYKIEADTSSVDETKWREVPHGTAYATYSPGSPSEVDQYMFVIEGNLVVSHGDYYVTYRRDR